MKYLQKPTYLCGTHRVWWDLQEFGGTSASCVIVETRQHLNIVLINNPIPLYPPNIKDPLETMVLGDLGIFGSIQKTHLFEKGSSNVDAHRRKRDSWHINQQKYTHTSWLVVSTPLKNISQLDFYSQYMENVPNHQPARILRDCMRCNRDYMELYGIMRKATGYWGLEKPMEKQHQHQSSLSGCWSGCWSSHPSPTDQSSFGLIHRYRNCLVVSTYPSEKWWSSSVGMMKFPIYGKIKFMHVPNHFFSTISIHIW
jgi:hypothetical protein